ncbi:MAG: hypothetical protein ABTA16_19120 [Niallia sp.]
MKIHWIITLSVLGSILLFSLAFFMFNGDLTPYLLFIIFAGIIIGILISIYIKVSIIAKETNK